MADDFLNSPEVLKQTIEQLKINQKFLLECLDRIHYFVAPGHLGTWQQRAEESVKAAGRLAAFATARRNMTETIVRYQELVEAVRPFIHFIDQFDRKPMARIDDQFYGIHNGTEFEANLKLSDFRKLSALLKSHENQRNDVSPGSNQAGQEGAVGAGHPGD